MSTTSFRSSQNKSDLNAGGAEGSSEGVEGAGENCSQADESAAQDDAG